MGLLDRLSRAAKGSLGALFAPAEDPRQTFASSYQRQRELLLKLGAALETIGASKRRLEAKTQSVRNSLPELEGQALTALTAGDENRARLILARRQLAVLELQTLDTQVGEVAQEEQRLCGVEQRVTAQLEAFHAQQEIITARHTAAEAQVRLGEALTGVSQDMDDLGTALRKAEEKTELMQARAFALDRLIAEGVLETPRLGPPGSIAIDGSPDEAEDRKSTRLNSSHLKLSRMPSSA